MEGLQVQPVLQAEVSYHQARRQGLCQVDCLSNVPSYQVICDGTHEVHICLRNRLRLGALTRFVEGLQVQPDLHAGVCRQHAECHGVC